jgi:hypothetical protein
LKIRRRVRVTPKGARGNAAGPAMNREGPPVVSPVDRRACDVASQLRYGIAGIAIRVSGPRRGEPVRSEKSTFFSGKTCVRVVGEPVAEEFGTAIASFQDRGVASLEMPAPTVPVCCAPVLLFRKRIPP